MLLIYVEKGENITVRNSVIHDSGNGFFVASSDALASRNILVEGNYIYDNGNTSSAVTGKATTLGLYTFTVRAADSQATANDTGSNRCHAKLVVLIPGSHREFESQDLKDLRRNFPSPSIARLSLT
jgi:hypothetical protein